MESILYAVGDVHGRADLLDQLHGHIRSHHEVQHPNRPGEIVYLGDYIDRGADSVGVIDRLMSGMDGFQTTCLMGNHEAMLLECLATDDRRVWSTWLANGGDVTVASLGLSLRFGRPDPEKAQSSPGS
ncbi:metallophosphoesterase [Roseibium salinum]|nr:metallophosphoesterase [Roseibium salinum]